jgi:hypothetical protein
MQKLAFVHCNLVARPEPRPTVPMVGRGSGRAIRRQNQFTSDAVDCG